MARIRTVKPDLFLHEDLYDLEKETGLPIRTAWIGLFCVADREGRFEWRPRKIKAQLMPYDDIDFSRVLHALGTRGFLVRYACGSKEYGWIPTFKTHQVINNKEKASHLPDPKEKKSVILEFDNIYDCLPTREARDAHASTTPLFLSQEERKGKEGKGKELEEEGEFFEVCDSEPAPADETPLDFGLGDGEPSTASGKTSSPPSINNNPINNNGKVRFDVVAELADDSNLREVLCKINEKLQKKWVQKYEIEWLKKTLNDAIDHHIADSKVSDSSQINDWGLKLVKWIKWEKKPVLRANSVNLEAEIEALEATILKNGGVNRAN